MIRRTLQSILQRLDHLRALQSVNWWMLGRRLATLWMDYNRPDGRNRCVVNITYEATYRCNQRCAFCFLRETPVPVRSDELTTDEALGLVASAARMGAGLYLTGGEPLLRKDIVSIVAAARKRRVRCGINTNGVLLTEETASGLARVGLDYMIVSLSSDTAEVHNEVVRAKGAFEKATENLARFISMSPRTQVFINFVISPESAQRLKGVIALAAELGVHAVTCQHMQYLTEEEVAMHRKIWQDLLPDYPCTMVYGPPPKADISMEEMDRLIQEARMEAERRRVRCLIKPPLGPAGLRLWYKGPFPLDTTCYFPWTDLRVAPNGSVYTCQFVPVVVGNIREKPIEELLNTKPYRDFRLALRRTDGVLPGCARCCKLYRSPFSKMAKQG